MSLAFPDFEPHPLIRGGHLQTILGVYLPHKRIEYRAKQHKVVLADGDAVILHDDLPHSPPLAGTTLGSGMPRGSGVPRAKSAPRTDSSETTWKPGDPVVLLLHGLGGCHL